MTEAKKHEILGTSRHHKANPYDLTLFDFEDNNAFAAHLVEQLRRLPTDTRVNAMLEIIAIINRYIRVQNDSQ